jgi:hypothetical protein
MANFIALVYATLKNEGVDTTGMSTDEAIAKFKELQKSSGGSGTPAENKKLVSMGIDAYDGASNTKNKIEEKGATEEENKRLNEIQNKEKRQKAISLMKSGKTPKNVQMKEFVGGTMDLDGNPVNMEDFKDGYLVSCMNDSFEENRNFVYNNPEFIEKFIEKSDNGELYVGSWFENGKNNNEPTIWVKDKQKAIELAKKTGQYSITDCAMYNKYKCKNYESLTDEQEDAMPQIFIETANDEEHKVKLQEVDW